MPVVIYGGHVFAQKPPSFVLRTEDYRGFDQQYHIYGTWHRKAKVLNVQTLLIFRGHYKFG